MTPHIESKKIDIANTVLMPGDPKRAKFIAENFLENATLVNEVRGMLAYTGLYKGKKVTVMASGMGMPSMGIYSYELFKFYDVENIIRIGSCGSYKKDISLYDVILVDSAYSDSTYALMQNGTKQNILYPSDYLNDKIKAAAVNSDIKIFERRIYSSDVFYKETDNFKELAQKFDCIGVEMESFALFHNAKILNKRAACILTVSDSLVTKETTSSLEREKSLTKMIKLALEATLFIKK